MKILHCIPSFGGGGAERQCVGLCFELRRRGHEVHVAYVLPGATDYVTQLKASGVMLHHLGRGLSTNIWRAQKSPRVFCRLFKLIRELRPDVVQSWNRPMDTFVGLLSRVMTLKWVLSENNSALLYGDRRERLRVWAGRRADAIVANSAGGVDYWRLAGIESRRLHVVSNPVAVEELQSDDSPCDWPGNLPPQRTILYVGRFAWQKNTAVMLQAMREAVTSDDAFALLCGTGELLEEARAQVRRWGLEERMVFAGFVAKPWQLMKRAAVLVSVSLCEGRPNVVTEAMAVKCPLVVSDIPAHREFLDESKARLVPTGSAEQIAAAIRRVLEDPAAARARAEHAEAACDAWRPDRIAAMFEGVYAGIGGSGR